ncbi:MAG TPA: hypothetical protein VKG26_16090 [Bacteroidia bacterium]|nr:hypothetical protein [Bacteroidia bacterium]
MKKIPLSVLDLAVVSEGDTVQGAIKRTVEVARHTEKLGYKCIWIAKRCKKERQEVIGIEKCLCFKFSFSVISLILLIIPSYISVSCNSTNTSFAIISIVICFLNSHIQIRLASLRLRGVVIFFKSS